ncbi:MAG: MoxR family ATPase [Gammaproteobacteria bacterium]|nr:MoxR family ATPase [Gammaproteobacteria bacterium]
MLDQTNPSPAHLQQGVQSAIGEIEQIIVGKPQQVRLAVCCLLSGGHCLIEDLPGVGKTTLAHTIAKVFNLEFNRIQFTSDLLPADILGVSIFDPQSQTFNFHPGPIFTNCVLADELNRATPKTQSALLEAMEEHQITVEGQTRYLDDPFFVIGTQNPLDQAGTFPLPESQLDRFMMKINLGYPDAKAERLLLAGESRKDLLQQVKAVMDLDTVINLQQAIQKIHVSDALLDYVQSLITATRDNSRFVFGLSPRAALSLLKAARSWAFMQGRDFVEPADIKAVFTAISCHRLMAHEQHSKNVEDLVEEILHSTAIP